MKRKTITTLSFTFIGTFFFCLPAEFIYEALTNLKIVWVTNGFLLKPCSLGNSCNNWSLRLNEKWWWQMFCNTCISHVCCFVLCIHNCCSCSDKDIHDRILMLDTTPKGLIKMVDDMKWPDGLTHPGSILAYWGPLCMDLLVLLTGPTIKLWIGVCNQKQNLFVEWLSKTFCYPRTLY